MGLMSLIARLTLDTSGFESGINRSRQKAFDFGQNLERDVGKKLNRFFGIGLFTGFIVGLKKVTFDAAKEFQDMADAADLTVGQLMRLKQMADDNAVSWEKFSKNITDSGDSLKSFAERNIPAGDQASDVINVDTQDALRLNRGVSGFMRRLKMFGIHAASGLSDMVLGEDLDRKHAALKTPEELRMPELNKDFMSLRGRDFETEQKGFEVTRRSISPNVNELQRVGAFAFRDENVIKLREQVTLLKQIDGTLKKISSDQQKGEFELAP